MLIFFSLCLSRIALVTSMEQSGPLVSAICRGQRCITASLTPTDWGLTSNNLYTADVATFSSMFSAPYAIESKSRWSGSSPSSFWVAAAPGKISRSTLSSPSFEPLDDDDSLLLHFDARMCRGKLPSRSGMATLLVSILRIRNARSSAGIFSVRHKTCATVLSP